MIINLLIPNNAELLLHEGDVVDFDQPFYQVKKTGQQKILISQLLNVRKEKIFQYLKKTVGQKVKKNEILAVKKGLIFEKKVISPFDGEVLEINHETGEIVLAYDLKDEEIKKCFFKAKVKEIKKNSVALEIKKGLSVSLKEGVGQAGGPVFNFIKDDLFFQITEEEIKNKIILIESLKSYITMKCEALGVSGFIFIKKDDKPVIPYGQILNSNDFKKAIDSHYHYCLFSEIDQLAVFY